ncbi:isochorismatase domain-containing protein 2 isoform X1 [Bos mutus]|uniref:isochorismatase domain-containing protein 2 isoform X1 n=1 Tax=Bos mutus TaxID=72004 RepID=UPI0038B5D406
MAAARPALGRVLPGSSMLFLCDMQEKFRHVVYFRQIVSVAARMLKVARLLSVPTVLTEQYPQGLGPTVPELGAQGLQPYSKTCFSMVPAVQQELDARPQLRSVLLCGVETQACILQTALDLLDRGLQVHVVVDACTSRRSRSSSRSPAPTAGCWAFSKTRTPSSADLATLRCAETPSSPVLGTLAGALSPPVAGSREWCSPPGEPPPREGGGCRLPIGPHLPEMQMKLPELGEGWSSRAGGGARPRATPRGGEGEGVTVYVGPAHGE